MTISFNYALSAEKVHEELYRAALQNLAEKPTEIYDYYVCTVCGYTSRRSVPERCPVCNTPGAHFEKIN